MRTPELLLGTSLRDVQTLTFKYAGFVAMVSLVVGALTVVFTSMFPPAYSASTLLLIERTKNPTLRAETSRNGADSFEVISTEIELIYSRAVAEAVVDELNLMERPEKPRSALVIAIQDWLHENELVIRQSHRERVIEKFRKQVKVTHPAPANLLSIEFSDTDPMLAYQLAITATKAYLDLHLSTYSNNAVQFFERRVKEAEDVIGALRAEIARTSTQSTREALELKASVYADQFRFNSKKLEQSRSEQAADVSLVNVRIVDPPVLPTAPKYSRLFLILIGLGGGLILGASVALIREYFDHTIYTPAQVVQASGLSVLGSVGHARARDRRRLLTAVK